MRFLAQLVEAMRYKPEGRGFDSRWCHWDLSLTYSFRSHYGPGVDSASNINECQEYFLGGSGGRCVWLTTLPPSCAHCLEIWEPQPPGTLRASLDLYRDCFISCSFHSWRIPYHKPACSDFWSSDAVPLHYWIPPWRLNWQGTFQFDLYPFARIRAWTTAPYLSKFISTSSMRNMGMNTQRSYLYCSIHFH